MPRSCSVAETRDQLPRLLRAVEKGERVEITRRGRPVAVVVSAAEYERLRSARRPFREVYEEWRASLKSDADLPPDFFRSLRDRSPGRDVEP